MNRPSGTDDTPPGGTIVPVDLDEPRRLRDEPRRLLDDPNAGADASTAWALGLLRGTAPYRAPAGRKQRVQLRLGHTVRRPAPLVLRLAVMVTVLCGGAAIVRAGLGHWPGWMARAYERVVGAAPAEPVVPAHVRAARREPPPGAIESPAADGAQQPSPALAPEQPAPREPAAPPRARRTIAATAPAISEDTSPVSAAMRALRVEHNPVRARHLLAKYLGAQPNGNLAEEALAMSIEAALAHQDADVAALASRYLRLYPQGTFQGLARQALAAHPGPAEAPPAP